MDISKAAIGIFAGACIAGATGGAFFATRGEQPAPAQLQQSAPLVSPDPAGPVAVEQSEVVIEPPAPPPAPAASRARPSAPQPRTSTRTPDTTLSRAPTTRPAAPPPAFEPIEPPQIVHNEPSRWVEPPGPVYEELVVVADSVIGLQIDTTVTSETARVEDAVVARVTRDVRVGDRVVIPAGSRVDGEVTLVERGGRLRDRARLGVRFTSIVLGDGSRVPMSSETIYREGDSPGNESAAKIGGGAIGGAIIGGILGGAKGAAIGGSAGAGAGTTAVLVGGRNPATLPAGTPVTVRIERPVTVVVEK